MTTALETKGRTQIMWMALALAVASLPARALATVHATAGDDGRTLAIVGDREANDVAVMFDAEDAIEVSDDGTPVGRFAADAIEAISIRLGGGADSLAVLLAAEGRLGNLRQLSIGLGAGDDVAVLEVNPGVRLAVSGGAGHDVVSGAVDAPSTAFRSVARESQDFSAALMRGGGSRGLGYTCTSGGKCTCDKSIENDCEDMSGVCRDADIDALINCINGWLTTHCECTKALTVRGTSTWRTPVLGGVLSTR